ncbi:MAG: glycosyltransferase [Deltaproteobacteria bacterium]|nr:glycosyltransferase [Deltaproteobacteria bacterium]
MKICFLAAANSIHSYRWIKFFADRGHEVHWISLCPSTIGELPGVRFYEIKSPASNYLRVFSSVRQVRRLVSRISPDVLHAHSAGVYGFAGALAGRHPFVLTAWGSDILMGGKSHVKRPFVKYILERADLVTCDAEHMAEAMAGLGTSRSKMRVIYFGIDTQRFSPAEPDALLRERLGIAAGSPAIISMRNFYPVYDIESLIRCAPMVLKKAPAARFIIVGSGPEEEGLKKLAASLGLSESVLFTGKIQNADLTRYLTSMDVYVSTALSDAGISASTAEAMSCGLPVVITDSGENGRWVKDGVGGFLVPVKSPERLSERILDLIENPDRKKIGRINRETIIRKNDYFNEMGKMEVLYYQMLRKAENRGASVSISQSK